MIKCTQILWTHALLSYYSVNLINSANYTKSTKFVDMLPTLPMFENVKQILQQIDIT